MIIKPLEIQTGQKVKVYKYGLGKEGIYVEEGNYILVLREVRHCLNGVSYDKLEFSIDGRIHCNITDKNFGASFIEDEIIGGFVNDPKNFCVPKYYSLYNNEKSLNYYKNKLKRHLESDFDFYKKELSQLKRGYNSEYSLETLHFYIKSYERNLKKLRGEI